MRRPLDIVFTLAVCAACAAIPAPALAAPEATARLVACHPALRPAARALIVEATMRRAEGPGERMQLRFDLLRRAAGRTAFVRIPGPGLGAFNRAAPGVAAYRFRKRIQNLFAAGDYRVDVTFRWQAADGTPLATLVRSAPLCRQPELRPDLEVTGLARKPGAQGADYEVTVHNAGGSRAGGFAVGLWVGGQPQPAASVPGLAPGEARTLTISAVPCPAGETAHAIADPARLVPDASRVNNVRVLRCPAAQPARRR